MSFGKGMKTNSCMKHSLEIYSHDSNLKTVAKLILQAMVSLTLFYKVFFYFVRHCETVILASVSQNVTLMLRREKKKILDFVMMFQILC